MKIAIDIDGTIAGANVLKYVRLCNERMMLGITPVTLEGIRTYKDFYILPEVATLKTDKEAWSKLRWLDFSAEVLSSLPALPGAVAGIQRLIEEFGPVSYYTARKSIDEVKNQEMTTATCEWLRNHRFPGEAVFCLGVKDKLEKLSTLANETTEDILLIDDLAHRVVEELHNPTMSALKRRLTLVAFGTDVPVYDEIQILSLPSWHDIDRLIECLLPMKQIENQSIAYGSYIIQ